MHSPNEKFQCFTKALGLQDLLVTALAEDATGVIWIGTYGGVLQSWDATTGRFSPGIKPPQSAELAAILTEEGGGTNIYGLFWWGNLQGRLAELKDGSFIGEMSFITGGDATATVRAVEPTRYLSWSKDDLRKLLNRNPSMRFALQTVLSTDLTRKLMHRPPATLVT